MKRLDPNDDTGQIGVRLPRTMIEAIDAELDVLRMEMPGKAFSRSDVVRMALRRYLADEPGADAPVASPSVEKPRASGIESEVARIFGAIDSLGGIDRAEQIAEAMKR